MRWKKVSDTLIRSDSIPTYQIMRAENGRFIVFEGVSHITTALKTLGGFDSAQRAKDFVSELVDRRR